MEATHFLKIVIVTVAAISGVLLGLTTIALIKFRKAVWREEKRRAAMKFYRQDAEFFREETEGIVARAAHF